MQIDWSKVKKQTLWRYEELIRKLQAVLAYDLVQVHYNHTMQQAQDYAGKIRSGYLQNRGDKTTYIDTMAANLKTLETLQIGNYSDLVEQVATREQCLDFLRRTNFDFDRLIATLNYLLRWVLPFKTPVREFIDVDSVSESKYLQALKQHQIGSNLDLLAAGQRKAGRLHLAEATGIPPTFITMLVHKADISRLAYVRGRTVKHLCGGGYDTLDKIARADLAGMEKNMAAYYQTLGKRLSDYRLVIPLAWMIGGAQILPRLVQEDEGFQHRRIHMGLPILHFRQN